MPSWAPNTDRVVNTNWGRSRGGSAVTGIWIHHQADGAGPDSIDYMIGYNDRGSHPTYAIDDNSSATVVGIIHPDLCPSSTGYSNDRGAITVEIANTGGAPDWPVSMKALEQVAQIIAHHAKESPRENRAERNRPGVAQKGFWVGIHKQVMATACPGPFVERHWDWIIDRANQILGGAAPAKPAPAPAKPSSSKLDVDGALGPKTVKRWQEVLGTYADGVIDVPSPMVREVQRRLNAAGMRDWDGKALVIDGEGIQSNWGRRVPGSGRWRTIWALQRYLGVDPDGFLDRNDSFTVRRLQERLNTGKF